MEIIYEPGLTFGGNCLLKIIAIGLGAAAIGVVGTGIMWVIARYRPGARSYVSAPAGFGVVMGLAVGIGFLFTEESMARVATDWTILEHRYCSASRLVIKEHQVVDITSKKYRKVVTKNRNNIERISHYLDIYVKSRVRPISVRLDAYASEVNLDAVQRLAPDVMVRYRREK